MELTIDQALQKGVALHRMGNLQEAKSVYQAILQRHPKHPDASHNLGLIATSLHQVEAALQLFKTALDVNPNIEQFWLSYIEALVKASRQKDAKKAIKRAKRKGVDAKKLKALLLKSKVISDIKVPSQAKMDILQEYYQQRRLGDAENLAISITREFPDHQFAWKVLGAIFGQTGRVAEALNASHKAVALSPEDAEAHLNFGLVLKKARFNSPHPELYPSILQLLANGNFSRPSDVVVSIVSLLRHDPLIQDSLLEKNVVTNVTEATSIIGRLDKLELLHCLMRVCPLPDLQLEKFFASMRSLLLAHLDKFEPSPELIRFLSTLSIHCFVNEYVYFESDEEICLVDDLEEKIRLAVARSEQPRVLEILCLASYRPLHKYDWCQKLEEIDLLKDVKQRLIEEPLTEREIARNVPTLETIADGVSLKVREQYEENPYPRWEKLRIPLRRVSISEHCDEKNLRLHSRGIKEVTDPAILIAGCGTGQHSIESASYFSNCRVTAIDLSRTSLAYAQRKTNDLNLGNLDYIQADILQLAEVGRKFDIIESAGVLHHMDEPLTGWKVLTGLLKPGGLMMIALYSELARKHIVAVREEVALSKVGTSGAAIKRFRRSLVESDHEHRELLAAPLDFYSLSDLRDLIFHVQEHRFTLPQIQDCLDELGLAFCGFESKHTSKFIEFCGNDADIYDLALWHQYEESTPQAFAGMYQFWCQKV